MSSTSSKFSLVVISIAALCSACTTSIAAQQGSTIPGSVMGPTTDAPRARSKSDVITADELSHANVPSTAEGVRRLRPEFLRARQVVGVDGPVQAYPSVYLNGVYAGRSSEALSLIALDAVEEIRYIHATQARDWWGTTCPCAGGVIYVRTRSTR